MDGMVIGINKGTNVEDATKFIAVSHSSVRNLIARWTGQVVSEVDAAPADPSMWVILSDPTNRFLSNLVVHVDTEFDFTDEGGMEVFVDGDDYSTYNRIYADEGRYEFTGFLEKAHTDVERVSVQTDGGFDLRCQKDEELSNEQETVFACVWR